MLHQNTVAFHGTNSEPQPNNRSALDFLSQWRAGGPWTLSAIHPDKKSMFEKWASS